MEIIHALESDTQRDEEDDGFLGVHFRENRARCGGKRDGDYRCLEATHTCLQIWIEKQGVEECRQS